MNWLKPYLLSGLSLACLTFLAWLSRDWWTLANFTAVYLVLVLLVAIRMGTYPAMVLAVASFLSINFFLIPPYYTFWVADSRHVLDLIVFLIVAILSGQLGANARLATANAQNRAKEQEILYRLTGHFNRLNSQSEVLDTLVTSVRQDLNAETAIILPSQNKSTSKQVSLKHEQYLLLKADNDIFGTLYLSFPDKFSASQQRLLSTCVSQAAMALQRIQLAEQASKSQKYEEADRLKTAILHSVSHDLRTPITIIKSSAHNLRAIQDKLSPSERLELATTIESEADGLNTLVGNLLDLSRLRAGALNLNLELNSLEEVVGDVAARVWELRKQELIYLHFPDEFPFVLFDYVLIRQAVSNLVDNALRYEPENSMIAVKGFSDEDFVYLRVINHGQSIPESLHESIMEPFYHGEDGRIGLGLAIAKGILETHHGKLKIEEVGKDETCFLLSLPRKIEEDANGN